MQISELNPGDIIKIAISEWRVNVFGRDISDEEFEVSYIKLNDSFPEAIVQVPMIEKQKDIHGQEFIVSERYLNYGVDAREIKLVEHLARNNKRWNWIVNRIGIGDNYPTLYHSAIAGSEYARYNWQTWGKDGFYHCPFCDEKLNTVNEIEETDKDETPNIKLKACTCEGWVKRYEKYEKYLKAKTQIEKLEKDMLKSTELPDKKKEVS